MQVIKSMKCIKSMKPITSMDSITFCKNRKIHEMNPGGSKVDYNGIIGIAFDLKITFPTCARVTSMPFG